MLSIGKAQVLCTAFGYLVLLPCAGSAALEAANALYDVATDIQQRLGLDVSAVISDGTCSTTAKNHLKAPFDSAPLVTRVDLPCPDEPRFVLTAGNSETGTISRHASGGIALRCDLRSTARVVGGARWKIQRTRYQLRGASSGAVLKEGSEVPRFPYGTDLLGIHPARYEGKHPFESVGESAAQPFRLKYTVEAVGEGDPEQRAETDSFEAECLEPESNVAAVASITPTVIGVVRDTYLTCGTPFRVTTSGTGYAVWRRFRFVATPTTGPPGQQVTEGNAADWGWRPNIIAGEVVNSGVSSQWSSPNQHGELKPRSHRVDVSYWYETGGQLKRVDIGYDCVMP